MPKLLGCENTVQVRCDDSDIAPPPEFLDRAQWEKAVNTFKLSRIEVRIAARIMRGEGQKEIAAQLTMRVGTLCTHRKRLYGKLHVR